MQQPPVISPLRTHHIPATDLLVGALYSSYHLVSPYILPTIKYLLLSCSDRIHINVTSISNPRYTVPHIAAMSNDVSLLNAFYEINGSNIDPVSSRSFTPFHVSLGKRHFKVAHCLLWMNCHVDEQRLMKKLSSFRIRHLMNSVSCIQHFALQMEHAFGAIHQSLNVQWNLNRDITQTLVSFLLPVTTYSVINSVLNKFERNDCFKSTTHSDIIGEAKECLKSLTELKDEMMAIESGGHLSDEMDPKMVLYSLYDMTQDDGMESYLHGDEYNLQRWKDQIKSVVGNRTKKSMFDTEDDEEDKPSATKSAILGGFVAVATALAFKGWRK